MKKKSTDTEERGRFAYEGLERVLHEKTRLGIMTSLVPRPEGLLFGELKRLCALTDGNLSRHLEVLREAGLVEVWKGFEKRRPQTLCRLSAEGRERFLAYLEQLEQVIRDAMPKAARRADRFTDLPPGSQPAEGSSVRHGRAFDRFDRTTTCRTSEPSNPPNLNKRLPPRGH